jgi:hypothetical protein
MAVVEIELKGKDNASKAAKKVADSLSDVDKALLKLAQNEASTKALDEAKKKFEQLTDAEKAAIINTDKVSRELAAAAREADKVARATPQASAVFFGLAKSALGAVGGYAALRTAALAAAKYMQESAKAAAESAQVDAKLEAILKATGGAAGMTADELDNLANALSKQAGIDDEVIKGAESIMLTFRNIAGDAFPRAMQAAIDMQTTFGGLESASMQLGKALNDPVAGMGALSRSGITFSDTQKEQIKNFVAMNDIASAQAIILAEVEAQVGGTAKAMNEAGDGSENLAVAVGNLSEAFGEGLLPATRETNTALTELAEKTAPVASSLGDFIGDIGLSLIDAAEGTNVLTFGFDDLAKAGKEFLATRIDKSLERQADLADSASRNYTAMAQAAEASAGGVSELGNSAVLTAEQIEEANKATTEYYEGLIGRIENVQSANEKYAESTADLTAKHADLQKEIDGLIAQGWSEEGEKVLELKDKQNDLANKMKEVQSTYSAAMNQMVLDQIKLNLTVDDGKFDSEDFQQYLDVAGAMGLMDEKSIELAKTQEMLSKKYTDGKIGADELKAALDMLASGKYDIDVVLKTLMTGITGDFAQTTQSQSFFAKEGPKQPDDMRATGTGGAWMTVPPGHPNDSYTVGLTSGEKYNVQTAGQAAQSGGASTDWNMVAQIFASTLGPELDRRLIGV